MEKNKNEKAFSSIGCTMNGKNKTSMTFMTIPGILSDRQLATAWQFLDNRKDKNYRLMRLLEAKNHKYILYRHLLLSSRAKSTRRSKTSSPPANRRGPRRSQAAASRSFLFVPDFRFVRALNELNLKWNSLPTSTSKRLTRKLAYLGQQRRKLSVVRDAKLGPQRCCSLWSECPNFVQKWWGPFCLLRVLNCIVFLLKSTQYKKLAPNALRFTY